MIECFHNSIHVEVSLKDSLLELVGDVDRLGVVSDGVVHDSNTLRPGVISSRRRRGRDTGDGTAFGTRTHVVSPIETICKQKQVSQGERREE